MPQILFSANSGWRGEDRNAISKHRAVWLRFTGFVSPFYPRLQSHWKRHAVKLSNGCFYDRGAACVEIDLARVVGKHRRYRRNWKDHVDPMAERANHLLGELGRFFQGRVYWWSDNMACLALAKLAQRPAMWVMDDPLVSRHALPMIVHNVPYVARKSRTFPYYEWPILGFDFPASEAAGDEGDGGPITVEWAAAHLRM
jgi:hypothetical protein